MTQVQLASLSKAIRKCARHLTEEDANDPAVVREIAMRLSGIADTVMDEQAANSTLNAPLSGLQDCQRADHSSRVSPTTLKSYDREGDVYRAPDGTAIQTPEEQELQAAAQAGAAPPYVVRTVGPAFKPKGT